MRSAWVDRVSGGTATCRDTLFGLRRSAEGDEPVGALTYHCSRLEFDDRLLAHLQIVIIRKFRKNEQFVMSWTRSVMIGSGRGSLWMVPTEPVSFDFIGSRLPTISSDWLHRLTDSADSSRGLIVTNEDGTVTQVGGPQPRVDHRSGRVTPEEPRRRSTSLYNA